MNWRSSSFSFSNGNCIELASWRKSRYSTYNQNCVETGCGIHVIGVRDTKQSGHGPVLEFTPDAWAGFIARLKA